MKKIMFLLTLVLTIFSFNFKVKTAAADYTLRVHNWQAYIDDGKDENGVPRIEDGVQATSIIDDFKVYYQQTFGKTVDVIYTTYETNEDMLNSIKTGGQKYDLVCPSDYVIQKMIKDNMLEKFTIENGKYKNIPNYQKNVSPYLLIQFENRGWNEFAVNYMWGTAGFIYDPADVTDEEVSTWDALWNPKFKNKITAKDSVRDTYIVGVINVYKDELITLKQKYESGDITGIEYNNKINEIVNRRDNETIAKVEEVLLTLKKNVFGFEVDSGKTDIISGKIDINFAWSGDAVYAISSALEENDKVLKYSIPQEASNIWFDAWVMPKGAQVELAEAFLDYLSKPEIAVKNMSYIGYTSAIGGDEIMDLVEELYGDEEGTVTVDLSYFFEGTLTDSNRAKFKTNDELLSQLLAQYPDEDMILRCGIMEDFGEQNDAVIAMWQRIKANTVPIFVYIIVGIIIVGIIFSYSYVKQSKKMRVDRQKQKAKAKK